MGRGPLLTAVPLRLGPLGAEGFSLRRSGVRWLAADGAVCRPGDVVAFCNIGFGPQEGERGGPFADERHDFQVALATRVGGRLTHAPDSSRGGFFDTLGAFQLWRPDDVIGAVEAEGAPGPEAGELRLMLAAGRRGSFIIEDRSGLMSGWHERRRAWRVEDDRPIGTLLCLGICELSGVIRGEKSAFLELFESIQGSAQVVYTPDSLVVPATRLLAEQMRRTPQESAAIAADLAQSLAAGPVVPGPADWIYAGVLLQGLTASPLTDRYNVLTRAGLRQAGPADAVILSLGSEADALMRHKRLGYTLHCHDFRLPEAGPALVPWLRANFEPVRRTHDEIAQDFRILATQLRAQNPATQILVCNMMSSNGDEDIQSYIGFDAPLGASLTTVARKELNLLLHDLARELDIAIVDSDAIAADMGGQRSIPDGIHQNGPMQAELRAEILRILRARRVPGFG